MVLANPTKFPVKIPIIQFWEFVFGVGALQHKHTHTVYVVPLGVLNGFQASQEAFRSQEESRSEAGARKGRKVAKHRVFVHGFVSLLEGILRS